MGPQYRFAYRPDTDRFKPPVGDTAVCTCPSCEATLHRGDAVVDFDETYYCDVDCLIDAISSRPERFGVQLETIE